MPPQQTEPRRYVLDGYALLAFLEGGQGALCLRDLMEQGKGQRALVATSVVNVAEALSVIEKERGVVSAQATLARLWDLPLQRHDAGEALALGAARMRAQRDVPYADCYALALARQMGATLVTGNPALRRAGDLVNIEWL